MSLEVEPVSVGRRSRWSIVVLVAAGLLIVGVGLAGRVGSSDAKVAAGGPGGPTPGAAERAAASPGGPTPGAGERAAAAPRAGAVATGGSLPGASPGSLHIGRSGMSGHIAGHDSLGDGFWSGARPVPDELDCGDADRARCLSLARIALDALPLELPRVTHAAVWRSLLCNDSLDCPPSRLRDAVPLGSVILQFADGGPRAWLNVVGRSGPDGPGSDGPGGVPPRSEAWIVRWSA